MAEESRPVTIHDVASLAGVAVSSVSRALSSHPDVSPAMKAKVTAAAAQLGYSPDPGAQSPAQRLHPHDRSSWVRDFANPYFGEIIHGVEEALNELGHTLVLTNSGGEASREVERIELQRQRRVDALILSSISEASTRTSKALAAFKRPVVLVDRDQRKLHAACVLLDHAVGVREATEDLIETRAPPHRDDHRQHRHPPDPRAAARVHGGPRGRRDPDRRGAARARCVLPRRSRRNPPARACAPARPCGPRRSSRAACRPRSVCWRRSPSWACDLGDDLSLVVCDDLPLAAGSCGPGSAWSPVTPRRWGVRPRGSRSR